MHTVYLGVRLVDLVHKKFKFIMNFKNGYLLNFILLIIIIILLFLLNQKCSESKSKDLKINNLIDYYTDSIRVYEIENKYLLFKKNALIIDNENLSKINLELNEEIKKLKANPIVIIKTNNVIKNDTIYIPIDSIKYDSINKSYLIPFLLDTIYSENNYRKLSGLVEFNVFDFKNLNLNKSKIWLFNDEIGFSMTTGIIENKDGKLEIFLKSDYPNLNVTKLDGGIIDPNESDVIKMLIDKNQKRFGIGFNIGYGININNNKINLSPYIGIGLNYNLIKIK